MDDMLRSCECKKDAIINVGVDCLMCSYLLVVCFFVQRIAGGNISSLYL